MFEADSPDDDETTEDAAKPAAAGKKAPTLAKTDSKAKDEPKKEAKKESAKPDQKPAAEQPKESAPSLAKSEKAAPATPSAPTAEDHNLAQAKTKATVKQDDAAAEPADAAETKAAPMPKDESATNPYAIDDTASGGHAGRRRKDEVEAAHDLNFGEEDEVKNHPKYKSMMDQILGRNWNYKDEARTTHRWQNRNRGAGASGSVQRYPFDGHGGKDTPQRGANWNRGGSAGGFDPNSVAGDAPAQTEGTEGAEGGEEKAAEETSTGSSRMDRRDGWQGMGTKHGDYGAEYDVTADGDGDDKEHEGYFPAEHETEEKEYLNDLYRRDYQPEWKDRGRGWRNASPYSDEKPKEGGEAEAPAEGGDAAAAEGEPAESAEAAAQISPADQAKGLAQMASYKFTNDPEPSPEDLRLAEEVLDVDVKKGENEAPAAKPVLEVPEFAKNEKATPKDDVKKSQKQGKSSMAQKDAKPSENAFDKTESVPHAKKKVRSRIVKENDLDVWDSIVDAVADDHDFMQQQLAESEVIDDLNAPKKRAETAKPKKTHHKKSKKKHARKTTPISEASLTQVAIEPTDRKSVV